MKFQHITGDFISQIPQGISSHKSPQNARFWPRKKYSAKSEKLFCQIGWSVITTAYGRGGQVRGVVVRCTRLKCTRLQHRTCKTSRGTSLHSWFQKKVPATYGDFIFFFKKKPNFENSSWIFFHLKTFLNFLTKYIEQPSYKLTMTEVSRNLRNIF